MTEEEKVEQLKNAMPPEARSSVESTLSWLVSRGIVSGRVFNELRIYREYQNEVRQRGYPGRCTVAVAHRHGVSDRKVYRIRGKFER